MGNKKKETKIELRNGKKTSRDKQNGKRTNSNDVVKRTSIDYGREKCVWAFDRIDRDGEFAFDVKREDFDAKAVFEKMIYYNSMTWAEIDRQTHDKGKSKHHFIKDLRGLSKECIDRIKKMHLDEEIDNIFSFALTNTVRVFGLRELGMFYVLWYDPYHKIYPSKKKNT